MAYARKARRGYSSTRSRSNRRTSYRRSPVRRASSRRSTRSRSTGGARTIRIELVNSAAPVARPVIGMKPAPAPRERKF